MIKIKRIYEETEKGDGFRILVDRIWPRGISKSRAKVNLWLKEIAPSSQLRKWYSHKIEKWKEFKERYLKELENKKEIISKIKKLEKENKTITLLFSAKDKKHNNAVVLFEKLKNQN